MKFLTPAIIALLGSASAMKLTAHAKDDTCKLDLSQVPMKSPFQTNKDGQVIENMYIYATPTDDYALRIVHKNVTVKNVLIHHAANSQGIFFWKADGLTVENVEVVAYGVHATTLEDNWGAQPCPMRSPFQGFNCANIIGYRSSDLSFTNTRVEGGSKGISVIMSPGAHMKNVVAKNIRGPFPAGQCFQINQSDGTIVEDFYCWNEMGKSWTEDTISAYRSSNVTIRNGVVDGNNAMTGIGVMYEGSSKETHGGLTENVEVRHAMGCFSGYPSNGLVMRNNVCADSLCEGTPERGRKNMFNDWQFGNNNLH